MTIDFNGVVNMASMVSAANSDVKKLSDAQTEVNKLAGSKIFNVGSDETGIAALEAQKNKLEAEIESLQEMIDALTNGLEDISETIKKYQDEMEENLADIMETSEKLTEENQKQMSKIQEDVLGMLQSGEITKEEFVSTLTTRIITAGIGDFTDSALEAKINENANYMNLLNALTMQMTNATTSVTDLRQQMALSKVSLNTIDALLEKTSKPVDMAKKYDNGNFIFSAEQTDVVDCWAKVFGKGTTSNATEQQRLGAAVDQGMLDDFFASGMSKEQAAFAISWVFDGVGLKYNNETGQLEIPEGTTDETKTINQELADQFNNNWGTDENPAPAAIIPQPVDRGEQDEIVLPERPMGDPIGFNNGNVSFDFVVDANGDNIFNGFEEFMGATAVDLSEITDEEVGQLFGAKFAGLTVTDLEKFDVDGDGKISGLEELLMYDTDGNGKIEQEELNDLMILKTDWTTGGQSFTSATLAGVDNIDLSMFQKDGAYDASLINQESWLDINNNLTMNRFAVNMANGDDLNGYQRLDDLEYLEKVYGNVVGKEYTLAFTPSFDEDGNVIDIQVQDDAKALESARLAVLDAKDALKEAVAKYQAEKAERVEDTAGAIAEGLTDATTVEEPAAAENEDADGDADGDTEVTNDEVKKDIEEEV